MIKTALRRGGILTFSVLAILVQACAQNSDSKGIEKKVETKKIEIPEIKQEFALTDFLSENKELDLAVEKLYKSMDDTAILLN